ncbi:MAG: SirB2 family protein [Stenotrophobium sp.]
MLEWYPVLKIIHVSSVCLSLGLFMLRGGWMLADSPRLQQRWVKVLPHVVDTTLLASAVGLVVMLRQYPFVQSWLTAKVLALVAYIVLGSIGLKYGRSKSVRACACIAAIAVFGYIVSVALTHNPLGFIAFYRN